jgi:hypothetical protein
MLTRALGCRYLWIDSLCIVQDDVEDWVEQAASMADVYSQGYLNIAATAATSSEKSLFRERQQFVGGITRVAEFGPMTTHDIEPPAATMAPVHVRRSHAHTHACVFGKVLIGRNVDSPLLLRAWVFQEKLLSRRAVFFTNSEMLWQCQRCLRCECGDADGYWAVLPRTDQAEPESDGFKHLVKLEHDEHSDHNIWRLFVDIQSGLSSIQVARDFWLLAVEEYSTMHLTQESDRPYAIAGIARRIQEVTGDTYLAGLWLEDLPRGLLWTGVIPSAPTARRRPGIPTWSWMSRTAIGPRGVPWTKSFPVKGFKVDPRLRVVAEGTFCFTKPGDTFGTVLGGQVQLEAAMLQAVVEVVPAEEPMANPFKLNFGSEARCSRWLSASLDCPLDKTELVRTGDSVHCVLVGTGGEPFGGDHVSFLVLRAVEGCPGVYRRIGVVTKQRPSSLFSEAPVAVVTIV